VGVLLALGGLAVWSGLTGGPRPLTEAEIDERVAEAIASVSPGPAFSEAVYRAVLPSLVLVRSDPADAAGGASEPDLGSGVVINANGLILTSLHIVEGASAVEVTFADGSRSPAVVVVRQPTDDIAVLMATDPTPELVPATIGDPRSVVEGAEAYAMGSPFGLGGSLSVGVISALDRSFTVPETGQTLHGLIQIDAAVNPGNSGGPLLDRNGHVIGIVTALINPTDDDVFIGIGLAVPIDVAGGAAGLPPY
jgi:S1-C subfamily serine protease